MPFVVDDLMMALAAIGKTAGAGAAAAAPAAASGGAGALGATAATAAAAPAATAAAAPAAAGGAGLFSGAAAPSFKGVASQFAMPGAPGSIGGTPIGGMPPTAMSGSGGLNGADLAKSGLRRLGGGMQGGSQGLPAPQLMRGGLTQFEPFNFSRNNYQFRRHLGF